MSYVVIDFETASAVDLRKAGAWKYAECLTTEVLCIGYSVNGEMPPMVWKPGDPRPAWVDDPDIIIIAHNCLFEKAIWRRIMVAQYGWPNVPNSRWHDSMAVCAMKGIPMKLERAAVAMRLSELTNEGHQRAVTAPSRPNKKGYYDRSATTLQKVYTEVAQDIRCEVELNHRMGGLQPCERPVWLLDQRINERGCGVDLDFVAQCQRVIDGATVPLVAQFRELTGGINPTQRDRVIDWVRKQGVSIPNLTKDTITKLLGAENDEDDDDDIGTDFIETPLFRLPDDVRLALDIRRKVGSASIKKLAAIRSSACADGRVRGVVQYHGAGPGRWVGRLFQPQNFPRGGTVKLDGKNADVDLVVGALMSGDHEYVEALFGDPFELVIGGLRHAIVPGSGRALVAGDYETVECRIVLALAGQHDKTAIIAAGLKPYIPMAEAIFKKKVDKEQDILEYTIGKNTVLGCFSAETLVLTQRGPIPILHISNDDQVWDGVEWVQHQGVASRGIQKTMWWNGVFLTPDHLVFDGAQWHRADTAAASARISCRALAHASASLQSSDMNTGSAGAYAGLSYSAPAGQRYTASQSTIWHVVKALVVTLVLRSKAATGRSDTGDTPTLCRKRPTGFACSIASQQFSADAKTPSHETFRTTAGEASEFGQNGAKIVARFSRILSLLTGGTFRRWSWTAKKTVKATSRAIFGLCREQSTTEIDAASANFSSECWSWRPVFDLVNAGPRNRFTILTDAGPLIVHNCGFQMGWETFRRRYCPDQTEAFAKNAVSTYREEWAPLVPKVWYGLEEAACRAVWDHRPTEAYGIAFRHEDIWLTARLPSGRKLYYAYPQPVKKAMPWDETDIRPAWTSRATKNGRFITRDMYGGLLTENVVQASARDLLTTAMFKCEKENLPVVLTVHDEIVAEPLLDFCDAGLLKQIMEDRPQWAVEMGVPIGAGTWAGSRYKK